MWYIHKISIVVLIVGALNWLAIGAFEYNVVGKIFGAKSMTTRAVYILVGLAAVSLMFYRDTYLPFLGETVMPCSALPEQIPEGADTQIEVAAEPGAKVLYWAAEPATEAMKNLQSWQKAYLKFMNVGVVVASVDGVATLRVRNPQPYSVPWKSRLEPHIHFRVCKDNGMMGSIQTVYVADGRVEGFVP